MALRIERKKDNRAGKCILHRIADIPGGVTVSTANLSGVVLKEGTPIGKGENGMYSVCKTAVLQEANGTKLTVKGVHHFKVGDKIATSGSAGKTIVSLEHDFAPATEKIYLDSALDGSPQEGDILFEVTGANKTMRVVPVAVVGSNMDVKAGENLFVDAWVHAVVREAGAPAVTEKMKEALRNVSYV